MTDERTEVLRPESDTLIAQTFRELAEYGAETGDRPAFVYENSRIAGAGTRRLRLGKDGYDVNKGNDLRPERSGRVRN